MLLIGNGVVDMKATGKTVLVVLIWLAVMVQLLINRGLEPEGDVVEAFNSSNMVPVEVCISAYGKFGELELAAETKEIMLRNLAKQLGITDGYEITASEGEGYQESTLTKEGKYGTTLLQLVSMDTQKADGEMVTEQTILSDITIYNDIAYAMECKELLEDIYQEIGMQPSMNLYIKGKTEGALSETRREELIDSVMESLNAEEVQEIENDEDYCLYGYTSRFDRVIYQNGKKINVNLAITYHEDEDMTYLHLAVPYISQSF